MWLLKQKEGEKIFFNVFFSSFRSGGDWASIGRTSREDYLTFALNLTIFREKI